MSKVFNFLWYKVLSTKISHFQVKNCDRQLESKNLLVLYIRKKSKNAYKQRKNENFGKTKKCVSFSCPKNHSTQKLGSQVKRCSPQPGYTQTHTHTKLTTEGTLSGFQDFFLQPIIKDRPNTLLKQHAYNREMMSINIVSIK